ncbi:MAG: hypothetical protein IJF02_05630 [Oscillospiraceae bacterium]|nr:hypothetical protein [Oscillospiraceae bacterium]
MKRSASLLMELTIMLLVFALAAALCVQAFVWADSRSRRSAEEDMALLHTQSAAEVLKHCDGDFALAAQTHGGNWDGIWTVSYDAQWKITDGAAAYYLQAEPVDTEQDLLGQAKVMVRDKEGAILAEFSVCWQEVVP